MTAAPVNILLVDDRPENLLALEAILDEPGLCLVPAQSGPEALRCVLKQDFAVILLDVQMPGMDGFETASLIKQRARSAHTPIIFLTAISKTEAYVARGYTVGAVDYVFKPIVPEIIRSKVVVFVELFKKAAQITQLNTELQQRTAELEAANRQLEHDLNIRKQMEETTRRLIHEQAARSEAEAALRQRDEFLSLVSHEVKTPLTSVLGFVQLFERRAAQGTAQGTPYTLTERDHRSLQALVEQTQRLNKLVASLFDLSRLQLGRLDLEQAPIDLCELASLVVGELQPVLNHHTVSLTCADGPLPLEGDVLRLEQVLQNLLQNAVKYSPEGGPIGVEVARQGTHACLRVRDSGIGIPVEAHSRIFERFYRASNSIPDNINGLGIGLYVVQEIVAMHGGRVEVASIPGEGSTFTVLLPLSEIGAP